jgi:hypothetical protein
MFVKLILLPWRNYVCVLYVNGDMISMHFFFYSRLSWPQIFHFSSKNASLRVPLNNLRDFTLFGVCPSARCTYAANAVDKYLDIFAIGAVSLNDIYTHERKSFNVMC